MAEDEIMAMVIGGGVVLWRWIPFFLAAGVRTGAASPAVRLPAYVAPMVAMGALFFVLKTFASFDVVNAPEYLFMYMVLGLAWTGTGTLLASLLGISWRDDVAERGNAGASWAIAGATVGVSLIYTGANIGDGPGWWVIFYTGGIALGIFAAGWLVLELIAKVSETITVDRDTSAGLRLGALFLATGAILGRASAGNWHGPEQAAKQVMQVGVAAIALFVVAIVIEKVLKPSPSHPEQPLAAGVMPAAMYVGAAGAWVSLMGWWT